MQSLKQLTLSLHCKNILSYLSQNKHQIIIFIEQMSHLRDIQKLRQNHNIPAYYGTAQRFSQPSPSETFNINLDRFADPDPAKTYSMKFNQTYSKYLGSKEVLPNTRQKRNHKRGQSNGLPLTQRRQSDLVSPGLSIYNFPMKATQRTPNPLTSRRERPQQITDFQIMPQNQFRQQRRPQQGGSISKSQKLNKACFSILYPIGKGGFGKVWKVENKKNSQVLAMKEMYKAKIIQKKSINSVMNQRTLLAKLKHPFIINMVAAFQDRQNLYLLMDYIDGGDLRYHIGRRRKFNQRETKFFLANMIIGLEYLHKNKIIHRDMKPQNMVFDSQGYLRITDLGISRELRQDNHQDTSGTPGYMSPEVICRKNHSYCADYFAVGVMGYEFMIGRRPYIGKNRKQIRDQILAKQAMIKPEELPPKWSPDAADFINKLLQRNPNNRLGYNGIDQIKNHPWMASVDWKKMTRKQIQAPYVPLSIEQNYEDYKDQISEDSVDENLQQNLLMLRDKEVQNLFQDYYFDRIVDTEGKKALSYTTTYSTNSYSTSTFS